MNTRLLALTFILQLSSLTLLHAAPPPELTVLRQQYEKVVAERVTAPFDASLASLNDKFTSALDNAIATAKAAGDLKTVLALEAEKKRLADKLPIPTEDNTVPEAQQKLRAIYQEQLLKLEEARTANHSALLPAYSAKLAALEVTLTKADRVAEAAEVLAYRESLASTSPAPAKPMPATAATASAPVPPAPTISDEGPRLSNEEASRLLVEWALQNGHEATVIIQGGIKVIKTTTDIPKDKFKLFKTESKGDCKEPPPWRLFQFTDSIDSLWLGIFKHNVTPADLVFLSSLKKLKNVELSCKAHDPAAFVEALPAWPDLHSFVLLPSIPGSSLATLVKKYPKLHSVSLKHAEPPSDPEFAAITGWKELFELRLQDLIAPLTDGMVSTIAGMENVRVLNLFGPKVQALTPEQASRLKLLPEVHFNYGTGNSLPAITHVPNLKTIQLRRCPNIEDQHLEALKQAKNLTNLLLDGLPKITDAGLAQIITTLPELEKLRLVECTGLTAQGLAQLGSLKKLSALNLSRTPAATDALLPVLAGLKKLKDLSVKETAVTEAGLTQFKKQRPDILIGK
jgi:hypothetical protein